LRIAQGAQKFAADALRRTFAAPVQAFADAET
jgi:hypothetical protein